MINVSGYITKNGLICLTTTSGNEITNILSVSSRLPYFTLNNSGKLSVYGPFYTNNNKNCPWVFYYPAQNLAKTDTLSINLPSGFIQTSAGLSNSQEILFTNSIGQLEPSIGTFGGKTVPGFNQPESEYTLKLGYNNSWAAQAVYFATYFPINNSIKRGISLPNAKLDDNGNPILLYSTTGMAPIQTNQGGSIDGRGIPNLTGIYSFVADESSPLNPMSLTVTLNDAWRDRGYVSPLTIEGSSIGKTWTWEFGYVGGDNVNNFSTYFIIEIAGTGINGGGSYTLSNEALLVPNNYSRSEYVDQNFVNWLTTSSGNTVSCLRWMDSVLPVGGSSNVVDPEDMMNPSSYFWGQPEQLTYNIIAIKSFNSGESPFTYWSQNWSNSTIQNGGPSGAIYAIPTAQSMLNFSGPNNRWVICEAVCDNEINLKSGQTVNFNYTESLLYIPCTNGSGSTSTVNLCLINPNTFMTSPSSFVFAAYGNITTTNGMPGNMNNVIGYNYVSGATFSVTCPDSYSIGYGPSAFVTGSISGTNYWANFSTIATDSTIKTSINDILNNFPSGRNIICEYGNELWNYSFDQFLTTYLLSQCGTLVSGIIPQFEFCVYRTAQIQDICFNEAEKLGRGKEIIRSFGGWYGSPSLTANTVSVINTWNLSNPSSLILMDSIHIAPYLSAPGDTTLTTACASIYSSYSGSIANGLSYSFSRSQWLDIFRHYTKYNMSDNGPNGTLNKHIIALNNYIPVGNQPSGFTPKLITYEGGLQNIVPPGVSNPNNTEINYGIAHDLIYDPAMNDWETACYQSWNFGGISLANIYSVCIPRDLETYYTNQWFHYIWNGQQAGDGSNNLFYQNTGSGQDFTNYSVRGYAFKNWIDAIAANNQTKATPQEYNVYFVLRPNTGAEDLNLYNIQQNNEDINLVVTVVEENGVTPINISGATGLNIYLSQPNNDWISGVANLVNNGVDGLIYFSVEAGSLSSTGIYCIQASYNGINTEKLNFLVQ